MEAPLDRIQEERLTIPLAPASRMAPTRFPAMKFLLIGIAGFLLGIAFLYVVQGPMGAYSNDGIIDQIKMLAEYTDGEMGYLDEKIQDLQKLAQLKQEARDISLDVVQLLNERLDRLERRIERLE